MTDLNLSLRTDILDKALNLEHFVNSILVIYLSIEGEERKAITNKSSSLSFKNKIDLLFDLEIFSKEEHNYFLLLMEFRNQFLHNIECSSFTYAVSTLGTDKGNRLLKLDEGTTDNELEVRYKNGFFQLYGKTIKIALAKVRQRKEMIEEKRKLMTDRIGDTVFYIDFFFDLIDKLLEICEPTFLESKDVVNFKIKMFKTIEQELENIHKTEGFQQIQSQLKNDITTEKLKLYFT